MVDGTAGLITADGLGWTDVPLRDELEEVYALPTYIAPDAQAAALAEFGKSGAAAGSGMMYVKVDDRISVAVIVAGRIVRTERHGGDLTHVAVANVDRSCSCGRLGCLGTVSGLGAILGPDFTDMTSEARLRLAADVEPGFAEPSAALASVLGPIVTALDIDQVVIGGDLGEWEEIASLVHGAMAEFTNWTPMVTTSLVGQTAVMLGAAGMVLSSELGVVWS